MACCGLSASLRVLIGTFLILGLFEECTGNVIAVPTRRRQIPSSWRSKTRRQTPAVSSNQTIAPTFVDNIYGGLSTQYFAYAAEFSIDGQQYALLVDTGSSDLLVTSVDCEIYATADCTAMNFVPPTPAEGKCLASQYYPNTGTDLNSQSTDCYGDPGSYTYAEYTVYSDLVSFSNSTPISQAFGSITGETSEFFLLPLVDGIIGLAYPVLSVIYSLNNDWTPLLYTMTNDGIIKDNVFALCFSGDGSGGLLVLGGGIIDNMTYTAVVDEKWYSVGMTEFTVNGTTIPLNTFGYTIVDSGTTEIAVTDVELASLPPLNIQLDGGVQVSVPSSQYIVKSGLEYYSLFISSSGTEDGEIGQASVILGIVFLQGYWVYFDQHGGQLGFRLVDDCNSQNYTAPTQSVSNNGPCSMLVGLGAMVATLCNMWQ
eukprot:CFRG0743T1